MKIEEEIKQTKFKDNLQKAIVNLSFTSNWMKDIYTETFKGYGLLSQHYNVLRIVNGRKGKPAYPGDIKEVMLDKGRDLTRLVDKMVGMGLLERGLCQENRRKMEIFITKKGIKVMNEISDRTEVITKKYFNLNEEEAGQLSDLLDKLRG